MRQMPNCGVKKTRSGGRASACVAVGILARRNQAESANACPIKKEPRFHPGGNDAALLVWQGCLTP